MAISQHTLRISIPASGAPPGLVPADCYPGVPDSPGGRPVVVPSLPLSTIAPDSADDSVTATMGSSRDESIFLSEVGVIVPLPTWTAAAVQFQRDVCLM